MQRIIVPVERPLYRNLNSYYIILEKFIEHFREHHFTGCIHFRSFQAQCILFFDEDEILASYLAYKNASYNGDDAISELLEVSRENNFSIDIYAIDPDKIYFWSNLLYADVIYKDLNAEFTDLEGLIKKMSSENFTGYITVELAEGQQGGFILFHNGALMPHIYLWEKSEMISSQEGPDYLIRKSRDLGGTFHVKRVAQKGSSSLTHKDELDNTLAMVEELLILAEDVVSSNKKYKNKFETFLKKKFLEKSETFECIDPLVCDFRYENRSASYKGNAPPSELAQGVMESVAELSHELGLAAKVSKQIRPWKQKYTQEIRRSGIPFFQQA